MTQSRRAHVGLASLVAGSAAVVVPATQAAPAAADPEPAVCVIDALSEEEIELGLHSEVTCYDSWGERRQRRTGTDYAYHYDANNGTGTPFVAEGASDCSGKVSFSASSAFNDIISSTRFLACTNVKHFVHNDWTGDHQLLDGPTGTWEALNGTLSNQVSSMGYG